MDLKASRERCRLCVVCFSSGKGRSFHQDGYKKGAEINSAKSNTANTEAESIRSRAESTGGCVKLKTFAEIRPSSASDIRPPLTERWTWIFNVRTELGVYSAHEGETSSDESAQLLNRKN